MKQLSRMESKNEDDGDDGDAVADHDGNDDDGTDKKKRQKPNDHSYRGCSPS